MYPEIVNLWGFSISSFGVMMAVGFLVGAWITGVRLQERDFDPEIATTILLWIMSGGILGSKLYFAIDMWARDQSSFNAALFSRDGITWYGGLIGGTLIGAIGCRVHRVNIKMFADSVCIGAAVGQAIGRVGCFLVGDDYGRVTDVAWAVAFPKGAPPTFETVHPTQLYEVAWLLPVAALLWSRRRASPFLFGEYIALNGVGRLFIEYWRVNPRVALGMTEPQWIGIGLIVLGLSGWLFYRFKNAE